MALGHVDLLSPTQIAGWAIDDDSQNPANVDIYVDGIKIASILANVFRPDLAEHGLAGGFCSFSFSLLEHIPRHACAIEVRVGTETLPNGLLNISAEAAANPWNSEAPINQSGSWVSSRSYTSHLNSQITGMADTHWAPYVTEKYVKSINTNAVAPSFLILGASEGWLPRYLRQSGFQGRIVASDIAAKTLARAETLFANLGFTDVECVVADLNSYSFEEEAFDFVFAEGVLHHVDNIEFCIQNLKRSMKKNALLFAMEYTGPFRFQLPADQVAWINAAISLVPKRFRRDISDSTMLPSDPVEQIRRSYTPPTLEHMLSFDPSEAVSGQKIPGIMHQEFEILEDKCAGGSILMYISEHFEFGLTDTDPNCEAWLRVLIELEDALNRSGTLPHESHFYVAQKT